MIKLGNIFLRPGMPKVAVSISDCSKNRLLKSREIDIIEIRIDQFTRVDAKYIKDNIIVRKKLNLPLILTIRSKKEGGKKNIRDERKLNIFRDIIPLIDAVDIELRSPIIMEVIDFAKRGNKKIIISSHNFKSTPINEDLTDIIRKAKKKGANIVKIATKANSIDDVNRLMQFTQQNKNKNIIVISLGNIGAISRLCFPIVGSLITYSYIDKPFGIGQIPLDVLQSQLHLFYSQYANYRR